MSPTADPTPADPITPDDRAVATEELPRPVLVGTHVALRLARGRG